MVSETRYSFGSLVISVFLVAVLAMWSETGRAATLQVPAEYPTIQGAIAAGQDGDVILVDSGTYAESLDLSGKALTLEGGADGAGQTVVSGNGAAPVITIDGGDKYSEIIGFTITNGGSWMGGIFVRSAGLTIRNSVLTGNSWGLRTAYRASVKVYDSSIVQNGGGVYLEQSNASFERSDISQNTGRGIVVSTYAYAGFTDCSIRNNTGGAYWQGYASATFRRCEITGNTSSDEGGAAEIDYPPMTSFYDSLIAGNSAGSAGGAISARGGVRLVNSTVTGNTAPVGAGVYTYGSDTSYVVQNSIIWGNSSLPQFVSNGRTNLVEYSDIEGGAAGVGNFDADPLFTDPANGDYSLADGSPCIEAGETLSTTYSFDLEGRPRPIPIGGSYDVGAYEWGIAFDKDADGHWAGYDDCDDTDPATHVGAEEVPYDGKDQDCDGMQDDDDLDRDGYGIAEDCNDDDRSIYPGAREIYGDGIDQDCDGQDATIGAPVEFVPLPAHNLGLAQCNKSVVSGNIIAVAVDEREQSQDLNADGDQWDYVIHYYDVTKGAVTNTGIAVYSLLGLDGTTIAYQSEDGFLGYYDTASGQSTVTAYETRGWDASKQVSGDKIAFETRRSDYDGDGALDWEVCVLNTNTQELTCAGQPSSNPTIDGDIAAFNTTGTQMAYLDLRTSTLTEITAVAGRYPVISGAKIVFEAGTWQDRYLGIYDIPTGQQTRTPIGEWYSFGFDGGIISILADEGWFWGDLNGDGDTNDYSMVVFYDIANNRIINTGVRGCCGGYMDGGIIVFDIYEGDAGADLNGDGDQGDCVHHYVVIPGAMLPGTDVVVEPVDMATGESTVSLTFDTVVDAGLTTVESSGTGPTPPEGFRLGQPGTYYDLSTTSTFDGQIEVCFDYGGVSYHNERNLRLFHYENGAWADVTEPGYPDTVNKVVCGVVTSLSPFALFDSDARSVRIDVKPGETPNAIKLQGSGVVPVAVLSDAGFDATTVAPSTLELNGAGVRLVAGKGFLASIEDVDGDGRLDTVAMFDLGDLDLVEGDATVTVKGKTTTGIMFFGKDSVTVIP